MEWKACFASPVKEKIKKKSIFASLINFYKFDVIEG